MGARGTYQHEEHCRHLFQSSCGSDVSIAHLHNSKPSLSSSPSPCFASTDYSMDLGIICGATTQ